MALVVAHILGIFAGVAFSCCLLWLVERWRAA